MAIKISNVTVIDDTRNITNANDATFTGNSYIKLPAGATEQRPITPTAGMVRYNSTDNAFEGYTSAGWGAIGGGGGGFDNATVISTNTTAIAKGLYVFTASLVLTLPASPTAGDYVGISNQSGTTTSTIAGNGAKIMGLSENMTVDVADAGFTLTYSGATYGWVIL